MRILLVYCNTMLENALPISICQLSACLKKAGHDVRLFDTTFYKWGSKSSTERRIESLHIQPCPIRYHEGDLFEDFHRQIMEYKPGLIGLSVVEPTFNLGIRMLEHVRDLIHSLKIRVALGGLHAIMAPETVDPYLALVDFVCVGEGESTLPSLCAKLDQGEPIDDHPGFWIRHAKGWRKSSLAPLTELDTLPPLDFEIFPESFYLKPMMGQLYRTISIELTRGCPYTCGYCCDYSLAEKFRHQGQQWFRQKSLPTIKAELDFYATRYNPQFVYMMSDSFLAGSLERVKGFFDIYRHFAIPFWFNTRPEDITEEKIILAKKWGCRRISIGVESGNEEYRRKIMRRNLTNERIIEAATLLHQQQISFSINVIIGCPDETRVMVFDSIRLARIINADTVSVHIFNPYHGTRFREICVAKGYIKPDLIADDFYQDYHLKGNSLSAAEVQGLFRTIPLYIKLPESQYPQIQRAEKLDQEGNTAFAELRREFDTLVGWSR